ncbi:MAG: dTDP-glucose 4,6-dehydratase [Alphaproteobacteria bacterium]|jgi:dTDP-glucose 4,6-dehydratase|nr:dTDP-glucose 4,6-dehydratase [Alphaproteobacteria bacterium]
MGTILVTGGAGFIGGNFVHRMVLSGRARVVTLDKLTYAGHRATLAAVSDHPNHCFVEGDIADPELVASLLNEHQPDAVVNFAAESHVDRSIDSPAPFIETNIAGVYWLLEATRAYLSGQTTAARDRFRFVQVSTDEVFGDLGAGDGVFAEATPYAPSSPYAASKAAADHLVRAWGRTYAVPAIVTNCSNNYGPFQFPEKLVPLTILNAFEGRPLLIYGDGSQVRDWLHVADHCAAIERVIEAGRVGETYLIGGRAPCTNLDLVRALCVALDRCLPESAHCPHADLIAFVENRPGHDRRYAIDPGKIERELGWSARETLDRGLEETVRWYLDNAAWWRPIRARSYGGERLGRLAERA